MTHKQIQWRPDLFSGISEPAAILRFILFLLMTIGRVKIPRAKVRIKSRIYREKPRMIRILSTIVVLTMLLGSGVTVTVAAQGEVTVSINAPDEVASGDNFTASVNLTLVTYCD